MLRFRLAVKGATLLTSRGNWLEPNVLLPTPLADPKERKRMEAFRRKRGSSLHLVLFLIIILLKLSSCNECYDDICLENSTPPLKFEDIVPKNYDKLVPPTKDGEPTEVQIKISVLNINYVDEEKQAFGVDIFFHQVWNDPRLRIPPTHNTTRLVLNSKWRNNLWTPDTYFKKLVDGKVNDIIIPYSYMVVDSESTLFFASRISLKLDCEMDLASYPHDVQECEILIMSREFSYVSGQIHLSRRLGYFLINKYIPCVLIICMSFITFWIPAEAYPARVTLSVTSLLTIVTQQYQSAMPSVSYVVALNIWMLSCIGFVFCSLLEYAFVIAVMNNKGTDLWPFRKLKKLLHPSKTPNDHEAGKSPAHTPTESSKMSHQTIDRISRVIFPACFLLFCICYFVYFCRKNEHFVKK
ncbi:Glycine receptor subunit alphaZ1 like protein [Argiope bruennichi]|uniref:Glycine receptor subunit alphaZ1 like protein n=1 Tax=Argiope bruennichi TaxID=94029 RepID=A0A8T0FME3_ARGBR|nr:Glycine receptor subunit alphaZ1 like protein [Argiope bruennichi]